MTVLVVDDDCGFSRELQTVVDANIVEASTLTEGVKVARSLQPDVVVLGAEFKNSKRCKGSELIPRFRRAAPNSEIVMVARNWRMRDSQRAVKLGAFAHVKKNLELIRILIPLARASDGELPRHVPALLH